MSEVQVTKRQALEMIDRLATFDASMQDEIDVCQWTRNQIPDDKQVLPKTDFIRYTESISACMSLPLPKGWTWILQSKEPDDPEFNAGAKLVNMRTREETEMTFAYSIPLAMLKVWWSLQDD
jgi:hypothetical protein